MTPPTQSMIFPQIQALLAAREENHLAPLAARSRQALRRAPEALVGYRQPFALDADRILHSRAYTRYIDKTQVFSLVDNDHITHRVLHVQLVSKIARTVGRFLLLNEDLIEAIALGHDTGHPPFGHEGESILAEVCRAAGQPGFQHNLQSVRALEILERQGRGWNLTLQTLDGILCHDGEVHDQALAPAFGKTFADLDREVAAKATDPGLRLTPATLEGCVARFADTIAYIGRDIEDAITLGLVRRDEIPAPCRATLGDTNGTIVFNLVTDLIENSHGREAIRFSAETAKALAGLKRFNYERIYLNPVIKKDHGLIRQCYRNLFAACLDDLTSHAPSSAIASFLRGLPVSYRAETPHPVMACDFIAGMTDDYFLARAEEIGCQVPCRRAVLGG